MAPVFSLLMSPTDVVVLVLSLNLLTTFQMLPDALRNVDWRLVARLFVPSLLGLPIGLAMLHMVDPAVMRKTIAVIVILVALLMLAGWHYRGRRGLVQDTAAGALSGVMTAIAGIGGPPVILYIVGSLFANGRAAGSKLGLFQYGASRNPGAISCRWLTYGPAGRLYSALVAGCCSGQLVGGPLASVVYGPASRTSETGVAVHVVGYRFDRLGGVAAPS